MARLYLMLVIVMQQCTTTVHRNLNEDDETKSVPRSWLKGGYDDDVRVPA